MTSATAQAGYMTKTTTAELTIGKTYRIGYRATIYARKLTTKTLTVTEILGVGSIKHHGRCIIFHGARGGKVVLHEYEIEEVTPV